MNYKCPNCGGAVLFDPESGKMVCSQCGDFVKQSLKLSDKPVEETKRDRKSEISVLELIRNEVEVEKVDKIDYDKLWFGLAPGQRWSGEGSEFEAYSNLGDYDNQVIGMNEYELKRDNALETDFLSDNGASSDKLDKSRKRMKMNVYKCTSCGSKLMINGNENASFCSFCGQPTIVFDRVSEEMQPDYIIPFKITEEQAVNLIKEKFGKGMYVPSEIKNPSVDKIRGIYIPYWLYTAHIRKKANLSLPSDDNKKNGGGYRSYNNGMSCGKGMYPGSFKNLENKDYNYDMNQHTRFYVDANCTYEKVGADASRKLNDELSKMLLPYDMNKLVEFDSSYMSGFYGDKYDVSSRDVAPQIHSMISHSMDNSLKDLVGLERAVVDKSIEQYCVNNIEYALLPAWFMTFRYMGKLYTVLVNGQTGKVVGNVPYNKVKAAVFTVVLSCVLSVLLSFVMLGIGNVIHTGDSDIVTDALVGLVLIIIACVMAFITGIGKMNKYNNDRRRFTGLSTTGYVKERQDKTWVR
jgi:uncharacterized Zn finger protein (UPF0148 family)/DNA-directed RNA polymerase subunit RPC12/RpoP